jgi:hypothetical protein
VLQTHDVTGTHHGKTGKELDKLGGRDHNAARDSDPTPAPLPDSDGR